MTDLSVHEICYTPVTGEIHLGGEALKLPKKERQLLVYLIEHPDSVHTKEQLMYEVWGYDPLGDSSTLTVHINRLRKKLERDPSCPEIIETVRGVGYRIRRGSISVKE